MATLELLGSPGSPYTRKMLSVLRYRRVPYVVHWTMGTKKKEGYPDARVPLLPTFYFQDDNGEMEAVVDSTPIIRRLEDEYEGRSIIPADPRLSFLNDLLEDFADEWLTKIMFHFRWAHKRDAENAAPLLVHWSHPTMEPAKAQEAAAAFADRQINRLYVVGSNDTTRQTIEESYLRLLDVLESLLQKSQFLFGDRPSSADFALQGQLTQIGIIEPTPAELMATRSPRLRAWIDRMDDLSGLDCREEGWSSFEDVSAHLAPLLKEIGHVYGPFLLANAAAVMGAETSFKTIIDGKPWEQPTFPYQAKCLKELRDCYSRLDDTAKESLQTVLQSANLLGNGNMLG
ncbi:glutathione S-transferase [Sneathiella sp. P13V-1]|uniref:glutathione S-transferase family protein n=1 Tax=Sneathiella sp. P13V-1 TaxID=2697366 RepID=UPI00187B27DD|nr:glutathione S-transferase family protein [Sneathiella sp. P13V-1]MBE7635656.1 glutathione S-transferase [Sneathiella sp. P13V-1]